VRYYSMRRSECSSSKLCDYISQHDTGMVTASRNQVIDNDTGDVIDVTVSQNEMRDRQLFSELDGRYAVIIIRGAYVENCGTQNEFEVKGDLFFAVDVDDTGQIEDDLRHLGEKWNQDSILFVPKGGKQGTLWGTSPSPIDKDANPPYGGRIILDKPVLDDEGNLTKRCKGRPFVFESVEIEYKKRPRMGFFSEFGRHLFMQKDWREASEQLPG